MRPANPIPDASVLFTTLATLTIFATPALAQNNDDSNTGNGNTGNGNTGNGGNGNGNNNNGNSGNGNDNGNSNNDNTTNDDKKTEEATTTNNPPEATNKPAEESSTTEEKKEEEKKTTEAPAKTTEEAPTQVSSSSSIITTEPTKIEGGEAAAGPAISKGQVTLSRQKGIPTYPAPVVPDTQDAPFMQHSTLPDGTVFIAVGAILGAFGVAILLWRFIVSCMLHRSVQRATMEQHSANSKASFPAPPAPFYKYTDQGSTMSLSAAAGAGTGRAVRRTTRGPIPSSNPSQSNLFFSPTAASTNANGGNRASAFLPSGFYAAGSGSPGPNHGHSISLTNLRPDSRGHYGNASRNTLNPSPPESPSFPAARRDMSASSLNLNTPPGNQRAPSAYLEDLLADDPSSFPPPHMPGSSNSRHSANLTGRTGSPGYRA